MKGLVIAGTHSGCGKTTITLGLMAALRRRGLSVSPFKVGPDFIDPGHHTQVTGRQSRNLDGWMLSKDLNREIFHRHAADSDIAVVEGVMGLFDGYDGKTEAGSTAQMAKWLGLPVVLVVDARSMARSVAALVQGFVRFDPDLAFAGVMLNRAGSQTHLQCLEQALADAAAAPCLGGLFRKEEITIPERHLGLFTAQDYGLDGQTRHHLADLAEQGLLLDALLERLPEIRSLRFLVPAPKKSRVRIAVAMDRAFCFYYPENLEMLEENGAAIIRFSPLSDTALPENIHGLYLGGGYPELHAKTLAKNKGLKAEILEKCRQGLPIYGECGGFMVLCKTLVDLEGAAHPMIGCFGFTCRMYPRLKALGYREIVFTEDTVLGPAGAGARGHEFHYSGMDPHDREPVCRAMDRCGGLKAAPVFQVNHCLGGYVHLHFKSRPETARHFVEACLAYRRNRENHHAAP